MISFKKLIQILVVSSFLFIGMGTATFFNSNQASAGSSNCYTMCEEPLCVSNDNATTCASVSGTDPCQDEVPCNDDPVEKE